MGLFITEQEENDRPGNLKSLRDDPVRVILYQLIQTGRGTERADDLEEI